MAVKKTYLFYEVIDTLVGFIRLHREEVCLHQIEFADALNKYGVQFYLNNDYPTAKGYFWVSHMLGNEHAYRNYLCI